MVILRLGLAEAATASEASPESASKSVILAFWDDDYRAGLDVAALGAGAKHGHASAFGEVRQGDLDGLSYRGVLADRDR